MSSSGCLETLCGEAKKKWGHFEGRRAPPGIRLLYVPKCCFCVLSQFSFSSNTKTSSCFWPSRTDSNNPHAPTKMKMQGCWWPSPNFPVPFVCSFIKWGFMSRLWSFQQCCYNNQLYWKDTAVGRNAQIVGVWVWHVQATGAWGAIQEHLGQLCAFCSPGDVSAESFDHPHSSKSKVKNKLLVHDWFVHETLWISWMKACFCHPEQWQTDCLWTSKTYPKLLAVNYSKKKGRVGGGAINNSQRHGRSFWCFLFYLQH